MEHLHQGSIYSKQKLQLLNILMEPTDILGLRKKITEIKQTQHTV